MWNVCFFNFNFFLFWGTCLWDILLGPVFQLALFCNFKTASGREEKAKIFEPKNSKINNPQLANKKKNQVYNHIHPQAWSTLPSEYLSLATATSQASHC